MDGEMADKSVAFICKIVKETGQRDIQVTLHGGEPLAAGYNIIETIIGGLKNQFPKVEIGIQSNLWLLDERFCSLFRRYNVAVGTSLDGPEAINDAQRGEGYFQKTMSAIRLARANGLTVGCIATFTRHSAKRWQEVFEFFKQNDLHFSFHPAISAKNDFSPYTIDSSDFSELQLRLFEMYLEHTREIKIPTFDAICKSVFSDTAQICTFQDCFGKFLAIDPHGDIFSCQRFAGDKKFALGNISDNPGLNELLGSDIAISFIKRQAYIAEACSACDHYPYCTGGCLFNALLANGDIYHVDPYCESYQSMFNFSKNKLYDEMLADENIDAMTEHLHSHEADILFSKGKSIDLLKKHHPYDITKSAKRIIAAYELGRTKDIYKVGKYLVQSGISKTEKMAIQSLEKMQNNMHDNGILNKLYLHVTWRCQLQCSHCYASEGDKNGNHTEMPAVEISKIIYDAWKLGFREIVITGGEPLIHQEIRSILDSLCEIRTAFPSIKLVLRTNLSKTLSIDDWTDIIGAFSKVVVSIDGDMNHHNKRRGQGSYEAIIKNLDLFHNHQIEFKEWSKNDLQTSLALACALRAEEMHSDQSRHIMDLAGKYSISEVSIRPILPLGRAKKYKHPLVFSPKEMYTSPSQILKKGFIPRNSCGIGEELFVEPSGDAYPCYAFHEPTALIGNIIKDGLATIIHNQKFMSFRNHTVDTNSGCMSCNYRYLCGGACRAWENGLARIDLDAAPENCQALRDRAKQLYESALSYLQLQ